MARKKSPLDRKKVILFCTIVLCISIVALVATLLFSPENDIEAGHDSSNEDTPKEEENIPPPELPEAPMDNINSDTTVDNAEGTPLPVEPPIEEEPLEVPKSMEGLIQDIPYAVGDATLAIVLDDAGESIEKLSYYTSLPIPLTIAVLPHIRDTSECASLILDSGKELILHQPMQAQNLNIPPGEGAIYPDMVLDDITKQLDDNFTSLGNKAMGLNNHEGSLITSSYPIMEIVLKYAQKEDLYFLDSRTSSDTVATTVGQNIGARVYERNAPFLDNIVEEGAIIEELLAGLDIANKSGHAIMIAHVDKSSDVLPEILRTLYPILTSKGYRFSFVSGIQ